MLLLFFVSWCLRVLCVELLVYSSNPTGEPDKQSALIHDWKRQMLAGAEHVFSGGVRAESAAGAEAQKAELFEQIGRLKMELEWLRKKVSPFP